MHIWLISLSMKSIMEHPFIRDDGDDEEAEEEEEEEMNTKSL